MPPLHTAIIKTLCYSDLFDYCLTKKEIYQYLIELKATENNIQKALESLVRDKKVGHQQDYYYLKGRENLVAPRQNRAVISRTKLDLIKKYLPLFQRLPYLQLLALTGTVAMDNAKDSDDIDLLLVFSPRRLFLGRLFEYLFSRLLRKRRLSDSQNPQNLFCPNLYLTLDSLEITKKDLFTAHEIVQMKPLINHHHTYEQFLFQNQWVAEFLPNTVFPSKPKTRHFIFTPLGDFFENIAYHLQHRKMAPKVSKEKISRQALFFHPRDNSQLVLERFHLKLSENLPSVK